MQQEQAYIIAMVIMCSSCGKMSFARPRFPGKIGPYRKPINAVESAFSTMEFTNQMRRCIDSANTAYACQ